jgi:hypothetical protein
MPNAILRGQVRRLSEKADFAGFENPAVFPSRDIHRDFFKATMFCRTVPANLVEASR